MVLRRAEAGADIGRGIRKLRLQRKWKQGVLSEKTGLATSTISLIETGKTNPTVFDVECIAKALDTTIAGLMFASQKSLRNKDQDLIDYVGNAVRTRRLDLGLSKTELAQRADLLPQYISTTENCRRLVGLRNLNKLADALDVCVLFFIPNVEELQGFECLPPEKLADRIKKLRLERNITPRELAAITGLSEVQYRAIESGGSFPRLSTLMQLSAGLNVSLSRILQED